jgi:hypothetical protein
MTLRRDARWRLRDANPVAPEDAPSVDSPQARALAERIMATDPTPMRETKRRIPRSTTLKILVPVVALALGAASYSLSRAVSEPLTIACYRQMSVGADVRGLPAPAGDPVAACRALWQPGNEFNPVDRVAAPPLMACLRNGGIAVFPHPPSVNACSELGLPEPEDATLGSEAQKAGAVRDTVASFLMANCLSEAGSLTYVQQQLQAVGLGNWQVVPTGTFTPNEPCAGPSFDFTHRTVHLAPVARSPSH